MGVTSTISPSWKDREAKTPHPYPFREGAKYELEKSFTHSMLHWWVGRRMFLNSSIEMIDDSFITCVIIPQQMRKLPIEVASLEGRPVPDTLGDSGV